MNGILIYTEPQTEQTIPYWSLDVCRYYNNIIKYPMSEECKYLIKHFNIFFKDCFKLHESVAQTYDNVYPYAYHLAQVINNVDKYCPHRLNNTHYICMLAAALHDSIEDARMTYNDIIKFITDKYLKTNYLKSKDEVFAVADIVYALTDERGKSRYDRHSDKYWKELLSTPGAVFVKCCDRLANLEYSIKTKNERMQNVYIKEMKEFIKKIKNADDWKYFDTPNNIEGISILNKLKIYI